MHEIEDNLLFVVEILPKYCSYYPCEPFRFKRDFILTELQNVSESDDYDVKLSIFFTKNKKPLTYR